MMRSNTVLLAMIGAGSLLAGCSDYLPLTDDLVESRFVGVPDGPIYFSGFEVAGIFRGCVAKPGGACGGRHTSDGEFAPDRFVLEINGEEEDTVFQSIGYRDDFALAGYFERYFATFEPGKSMAVYFNDLSPSTITVPPSFEITSPKNEDELIFSISSGDELRFSWSAPNKDDVMSWRINSTSECAGVYEASSEYYFKTDTDSFVTPHEALAKDAEELPPEGCKVRASITRSILGDLGSDIKYGGISFTWERSVWITMKP